MREDAKEVSKNILLCDSLVVCCNRENWSWYTSPNSQSLPEMAEEIQFFIIIVLFNITYGMRGCLVIFLLTGQLV